MTTKKKEPIKPKEVKLPKTYICKACNEKFPRPGNICSLCKDMMCDECFGIGEIGGMEGICEECQWEYEYKIFKVFQGLWRRFLEFARPEE